MDKIKDDEDYNIYKGLIIYKNQKVNKNGRRFK